MFTSISVFIRRASTLMIIAALMLIGIFTINLSTVHAATTWTVTTTADDAAGGTCNTTCTLRDALNSAQNGDTIQFHSGVTGTIMLGSAGTLNVNTSVTINGPGVSSLAIDGNNSITVVTINDNVITLITNLTIQHGYAGGSSGLPGGIYNKGTLTIINCLISNNVARLGSGIYNYDNRILIINDSAISNNVTGSNGYSGAVENEGTMIVNSSVFSNNQNNAVNGQGGGIYNGKILTVSNSTFSGNSAPFGGGVENSGSLTISNSTFSGNSASFGGGIDNQSTLNLLSNIIAKNTASNSGPDVYVSGGTVTSLGYNLIGDGTNSGITAATGDPIGTSANPIDPLLSALANNGGSTQTRAITSASPAYKKGYCGGNNSATPVAPAVTTDQRGQPRKGTTTGCDVGAYEALSLPTSTPTNTATDSPTSSPSITPTNTPTTTATNTATLTNSPTYTPTATASATATVTSSSTVTNTRLPAKIDSIGIYRAGTFYLRLHNSQGFADFTVGFNPAGHNLPVVGDWTGSGYDTVGVFDQNSGNFTLCNANVTATCANVANQIKFTLGAPNDTPLAGRWMLSATHAGAGVYRPGNGVLYLKNTLTTGYADNAMVMGIPGDEGVAGDWTGKGFDSPGIFRPGNIGFYLSNQVTSGVVYADISLTYGSATDLPIAGDWIAQGHDGVGMFRPTNGFVYLKNALTTGYADNSYFYGVAGDQPVAGHWQAIYPPAPPAPVLIAKTAIPQSGSGSVPGDNQIGG